MPIAQAVFGFLVVGPFEWRADWAWGLPLIVLTLTIHVSCLGLISQRAVRTARRILSERLARGHRHSRLAFVVMIGITSLLSTTLHGLEVIIWALAYRVLGAIPDYGDAMLYSVNAMTSYGHTDQNLHGHWRLMGALEALNGWLLFGMTTAFLFAVIQKVWELGSEEEQP